MASSLHLNPQEVVVEKLEDLVNILFARGANNNAAAKDVAPIPSSVLSACVWTLALVAPQQVYERLATEVLEILKNPALKEVSKVDLEIAALPEGELYNQEVIKCKWKERLKISAEDEIIVNTVQMKPRLEFTIAVSYRGGQ